MIISGYDCWKRKGLSRRRKLENVGAETTTSGSPFQIRGPETLKVQLPTVVSRNIGTTRRLELEERSACRPCRCATRSSGPRYCGAVSYRTLYVQIYLYKPKYAHIRKKIVTECEYFNFADIEVFVDHRKLDNDVSEAKSLFIDVSALDTDCGSVRYSARILTTQRVVPQNRCVKLRMVIS